MGGRLRALSKCVLALAFLTQMALAAEVTDPPYRIFYGDHELRDRVRVELGKVHVGERMVRQLTIVSDRSERATVDWSIAPSSLHSAQFEIPSHSPIDRSVQYQFVDADNPLAVHIYLLPEKTGGYSNKITIRIGDSFKRTFEVHAEVVPSVEKQLDVTFDGVRIEPGRQRDAGVLEMGATKRSIDLVKTITVSNPTEQAFEVVVTGGAETCEISKWQVHSVDSTKRLEPGETKEFKLKFNSYKYGTSSYSLSVFLDGAEYLSAAAKATVSKGVGPFVILTKGGPLKAKGETVQYSDNLSSPLGVPQGLYTASGGFPWFEIHNIGDEPLYLDARLVDFKDIPNEKTGLSISAQKNVVHVDARVWINLDWYLSYPKSALSADTKWPSATLRIRDARNPDNPNASFDVRVVGAITWDGEYD